MALRRALACLAILRRAQAETRFAVCLTGQLRTGTYPEMQENLRLAVTEPLDHADVFAVVAREHMLKHIDYHIPRNGCYFDRRKCARRDGSEGEVVSEVTHICNIRIAAPTSDERRCG